MSTITDLKIQLDLLRKELDEELTYGCSIDKVKKLHASIQKIEKTLGSLKKTISAGN